MNEGKKIGPIIGAFIIVVLLIVAAIYIWGQRLNKNSGAAANQNTQTATSDQQAGGNTQPRNDAGASMSTSDDASALGTDLNNTGDVDVSF